MAQRVLAGAELYRDIVDVNPPLIVYLSLLPAALAAALGISVVVAFDLCVVGLAAISLLAVRRIAWRTGATGCRDPLVLAAGALLLAAVPGGDFGQREHLIVLFVLPYLTVVTVRLENHHVAARTAFAAGLWAAIGCSLKPHYLLVPLLIRVATAVRLRRLFDNRRPENEGLVVGLGVYGLHFFLLPDLGQVRAGIELVTEVYGAFRVPFGEVLGRPWIVQAWLLAGGVTAAVLLARRDRVLLTVLWLALLGCLAATLWQAKGWSYHALPVHLLGWWALLHYWLVHRGPAARSWLVGGLLVWAGLLAGERWLQRDPTSGAVHLANTYTGLPAGWPGAADLQPGDGLLVLDTRLHPFFAWMADRRLRWCSRYACLWPLPGAGPARRAELLGQVVADLAAGRPRLVLVPRQPLRHLPDLDVLAWLQSHPQGRRLWSAYQPAGVAAEFTVYRRRGD